MQKINFIFKKNRKKLIKEIARELCRLDEGNPRWIVKGKAYWRYYERRASSIADVVIKMLEDG